MSATALPVRNSGCCLRGIRSHQPTLQPSANVQGQRPRSPRHGGSLHSDCENRALLPPSPQRYGSGCAPRESFRLVFDLTLQQVGELTYGGQPPKHPWGIPRERLADRGIVMHSTDRDRPPQWTVEVAQGLGASDLLRAAFVENMGVPAEGLQTIAGASQWYSCLLFHGGCNAQHQLRRSGFTRPSRPRDRRVR